MAMIADAEALQRHFDGWLARSAGEQTRTRLRTRIGTHALEIYFHDPQLATAYGRALKHSTPSPTSTTALALHVIAEASSDLPRPGLAWTRSDFGLKRVVPGWSDDRRATMLLRTETGLAIVNWEEHIGYVWMPGSDVIPWWERAAPFRWLIDQLAQRLGMCTLHAGVVSRSGQGALIAGPGGSGKSTLSLACLGVGLDYLADDYCLFERSSLPTCFNLYSSAKWSKDATVSPAWIGGVPADALDQRGDKSILFVDELEAGRIASQTCLAAIVLPRFAAGGASRVSAATPQEAFRRLAPSTIAQSEADGRHLSAAIARLVKTIPAFYLDMPPRAEESALAVSTLLDRLRAERGSSI